MRESSIHQNVHQNIPSKIPISNLNISEVKPVKGEKEWSMNQSQISVSVDVDLQSNLGQ